MATPAAYARTAYKSYASHAPQAGPASVHPIREAVWQSTCGDLVRLYSEAYVGRDGQRAGVGDLQAVEAERDCYAGAGDRFEHTVRGSLDAGIDEFGVVAGAPAVGTVGQILCPMGATGMLVGTAMLPPSSATSTPFRTTGALQLGQPEPPAEFARMSGVTEHFGTVGAAEYIDVAGYTVSIWTTGEARYPVRGGPAGVVRQRV